MTKDELIDLLADVLSGLQVPLSLGGPVLGAAEEPYRKVIGETGFGWKSADDFRDYLHETLE